MTSEDSPVVMVDLEFTPESSDVYAQNDVDFWLKYAKGEHNYIILYFVVRQSGLMFTSDICKKALQWKLMITMIKPTVPQLFSILNTLAYIESVALHRNERYLITSPYKEICCVASSFQWEFRNTCNNLLLIW